MSISDFQILRGEYESEGVGELLYQLILEIVTQVTRHYPPAVYSPNGIWDEDAVSALCHDFTIEKLLKAGWLEHYLLALETVDQLHHVLRRDFRHFLINRRAKSEFQNFVVRVRKLLREDSGFRPCSCVVRKEYSWGLSLWDTQDTVQKLTDVTEAMFQIPLPQLVRYRSDSRKVSHLLDTRDLRRLLIDTLGKVGKCIPFELLIDALRYRLNLHDVELVSLDEPLDAYEESAPTLGDILAMQSQEPDSDLRAVARDICDQLSERQRRVLALYVSVEKPTLEQIGSDLGCSKSTVGNDLSAIERRIASTELSDEDAESLLELLSELCVSHTNPES